MPFRLRYLLPQIIAALLGLAASTAEPEREAEQKRAHIDADLILMNARILDPENRTIIKTNIVIRDGKIDFWSDKPVNAHTGQSVDLEGRWVLPGLIDTHTHSFGNRGPNAPNDNPGTEAIAERVIEAGVTGFIDLFGDEQELLNSRTRQHNGKTGGATIYASLSCLTAPGGHCSEYGIPTRLIASPDEARIVISDLALHKPDVIKIVYQPTDDQPSIDLATLQATVETANKHGIPSIVHIKTWQDAIDVAKAGATAFTHIPAEAITEDIAAEIAATGIVSIPTLTVHIDLTRFLFDPDVLDAPLARAMTSQAIINGYRSQETLDRFNLTEERRRARNAVRLHSVKMLHDARVPILAGTDGGNWGVIQGYSVHREMALLREAGIDPWTVLAAATTGPAKFLNQQVGLEPGGSADLIVLNKSPITDITNTQTLHMVIHRGKVVHRRH